MPAATEPLITALVYSDSAAADRLLGALARALAARGFRLAGLVQHNDSRPGRSRCDMLLEDLATGERVGISEDRGPHARGCMLDHAQLGEAMAHVSRALAEAPDLVLLNKFGKTESEGGGFRPLIAEIAEAGLPLIIGVPWRNIESWRRFAGPLAREIALDPDGAPAAFETILRAVEGGIARPAGRAPGAARP